MAWTRRFANSCFAAVLPELTAGRCAAVSENARAAQWLERIDRDGLFVTRLDADELTLRLHDLFRDFLLHRLQRERPGLLPQLYRRAAAGERDPVRRVGLLAVAGAWDEAQQTLAAAAPLMLAQGDSGQVLRLVGQFPAEMRERSPVLALVRGMCAWPRWEGRLALTAYMVQNPDPNHDSAYEAVWSMEFGPGEFHRAIALGVEVPADMKTFVLAAPVKPGDNHTRQAKFSP